MSKKEIKRLVILNIPYLILGLLATNLGEAWRLAEGIDISAKLLAFFSTVGQAFANPMPSFYPSDLLVGLFAGGCVRLAVYLKGKNAKKYRHNMEYGSARWGTAKDIEPFMAPKFEDNIILTKTERLMLSNRPDNPKNARNKNVLIVGGSGSGKTRFWIKPNLLQCNSKEYPTSFVVTDPKGQIICECGNALLKHGYRIKIFNTINFKKSMRYNPFAYVHSEKDILKLVTTLMANTKGDGKSGDEFWEKSEKLLYTALIAYIHYEAPVEEQNFATLLTFLNAMEVREDDEEFQNPVDLMFEALERKKPDSFAVRQYRLYKLAAGKTAKSILISCGARLAPFDIQELREITAYDELQLDTLGDRKTALFLIMSDTDSTFNFLISMVYTQLFNLLCEKADDVYAFLATDDDIIVCDPESEYTPLVTRMGGQVIKISPASTQYINPMDINSNYSEEDNPIALKADFILSLCELVVGGKEGLQPVEKTVIDRCVHQIYQPYFENPVPENMPLLEDLYNALLAQDEKEAHHVATALEIYVKGSLNLFNHRTNVDIENRFVCYDIKELGKQLKKIGMLIVQDQVWGRVTKNRGQGKTTRYYMDEFHLLLKEEQTASYSVEIWKRFRKWGGIPTGITQNVKDLLSSREVENIFENSDFIIMLNQAAGDRQILANQLNISPHQLSYVTHSGEGEGLLFYGNVILPFVDHFPTDLELYSIMTSKLSEVMEREA